VKGRERREEGMGVMRRWKGECWYIYLLLGFCNLPF